MTELAGARREQYAGYQPVFWRPAANAEQLHRPYLARLVDDEDVITLVTGRRSGGRGDRAPRSAQAGHTALLRTLGGLGMVGQLLALNAHEAADLARQPNVPVRRPRLGLIF
jgi:hypothetical protein